MFDEDDLGEFVFYIGQLNELLTKEYLLVGDKENAIKCFEKSVESWIAYNNLPETYEYKNILINHRPCLKIKLSGNYTTLERYKKAIDCDTIYDDIKNEKRFLDSYNKLY